MSEEQDTGFLRRWSQRKRRAEEEQALPEEAAAETEAEEGEAEVDPEEQQRLIDSLPDIETLTDQSDLSAFMQRNVPDELRNRALRKMWRSNPVYACVDGLNDYDLDYTDAAMVVKNLKTSYQVGKGFVRKVQDTTEAVAPAETAEPETQTAEEQGEAEPEAAPSDPPQIAESPAEAEAEVAMDRPRAEAPRQPPDQPPERPKAAQRRWGIG